MKKKLLIIVLAAIGLILLATAVYLGYLFFTVVLPIIPTLIYSFLK